MSLHKQLLSSNLGIKLLSVGPCVSPKERNENSQQLGVTSKRKCVADITAKINHHAEVTLIFYLKFLWIEKPD